ncbi:hypothetical protein [Nitratidesulfovibrio vulgaris]|uniref:Uncharacterized protein n=1 Tax=Nitratidesulfovibrio vulgaris (strain DP4) TaxID=391774 RepID=A0A0H3A505_NITV4|nr:hypothetical protein [Nitratidesulfovibrio vulgaris]ABM27107.1 hypothetical protein Dvul_0083 [Nitratidesulfovibrio vulgaris DP4]
MSEPYYPRAFRLHSREMAMVEADDLAVFLSEVTAEIAFGSAGLSDQAQAGLGRAFSLLRDLIAIGGGADLALPTFDGTSPWRDAPPASPHATE